MYDSDDCELDLDLDDSELDIDSDDSELDLDSVDCELDLDSDDCEFDLQSDDCELALEKLSEEEEDDPFLDFIPSVPLLILSSAFSNSSLLSM